VALGALAQSRYDRERLPKHASRQAAALFALVNFRNVSIIQIDLP
jgi:hypothetical protein